MDPYHVRDSELAYEGHLSRVRVDTVAMPDGDEAFREVVEHPDAVAVVPVTVDGDVVLLRQYRHPVRSYQLEIPAGKLDVRGEESEAAARRELHEEAGLRAGKLEWLVRFYNSSGWTDEATTVYLARDVEDVGLPPDFTRRHEESDMELIRVPLREAAAKAFRGELTDAKTAIGLLCAFGRLEGLDT